MGCFRGPPNFAVCCAHVSRQLCSRKCVCAGVRSCVLSPRRVLGESETCFGAAKSKTDVLRALQQCSFLHRIPLSPPVVPIAQAHKDFKRERVLLNDVAFIPHRERESRSAAFSLTLELLVSRLLRTQYLRHQALPRPCDDSVYSSAQSVCDLILQRACRTSAGADAFFAVQKMLCVEGTFVSQKAADEVPPIHIDVFLAHAHTQTHTQAHAYRENHATIRRMFHSHTHDGSNESEDTHNNNANNAEAHTNTRNDSDELVTIPAALLPQMDLCCRIEVSNSFAVFDVHAMEEISGDEERDPRPWLEIDAMVIDESNFRAHRHWRRLHLTVTCPETNVTYSSCEDLLHFDATAAPPSLSHSLSTTSLAAAAESGERVRESGRKALHELSSWFTRRGRFSSRNGTESSATLLRTDDDASLNINMNSRRAEPSDLSSVHSLSTRY